ncbi:MAG: flagellar protein [Lachnospiraceae bacterium]|nr:flagellar protein [Lachnospiraceae bacterium]
MNVRNCKKCGKMFNYMGGPPICQACKEAAEKKFQEVKDFVRQNKTATMKEIVEACEVEQRQVEQWIREERLVFAQDSPIQLSCETCGTRIATGRYCEKCKKDQANTFSAAGRQPEAAPKAADKKDAGPKMYTFHK